MEGILIQIILVKVLEDPDLPFSQDHFSWMVRFKTKDGQEYNATQLYFVTNEVWNKT
ncbi:hypothetical protein [Bacillus sp. FJAT-27445]|uniref:hypothetical protein n=1 Tax=Bacillus sp. FJAT-27445 TaxID=1679166 RepID=UPI0012E3D532|nr:hypothetical protein [Bacillus sp. FJAT-27445]